MRLDRLDKRHWAGCATDLYESVVLLGPCPPPKLAKERHSDDRLHVWCLKSCNPMAKRSAPWEGGKVYPVELGESFVSHHAFHTLKYDFKPKSIDYDSLGTLASDGRNIQVTLKVRLRLKEPPHAHP